MLIKVDYICKFHGTVVFVFDTEDINPEVCTDNPKEQKACIMRCMSDEESELIRYSEENRVLPGGESEPVYISIPYNPEWVNSKRKK